MTIRRSSYNQGPCQHCGEIGAAHDRRRVYPDDGPAGTYHYEYHCPTGDGRYEQ